MPLLKFLLKLGGSCESVSDFFLAHLSLSFFITSSWRLWDSSAAQVSSSMELCSLLILQRDTSIMRALFFKAEYDWLVRGYKFGGMAYRWHFDKC
ncbi:hypothetical protein PABG_11134 [Paracoccidioides brasiliensis Pb03]|nr:hypothetical protein PABG_11134 [Paracoccidioides brasiliensis Pb03]